MPPAGSLAGSVYASGKIRMEGRMLKLYFFPPKLQPFPKLRAAENQPGFSAQRGLGAHTSPCCLLANWIHFQRAHVLCKYLKPSFQSQGTE